MTALVIQLRSGRTGPTSKSITSTAHRAQYPLHLIEDGPRTSGSISRNTAAAGTKSNDPCGYGMRAASPSRRSVARQMPTGHRQRCR